MHNVVFQQGVVSLSLEIWRGYSHRVSPWRREERSPSITSANSVPQWHGEGIRPMWLKPSCAH